MLEKEEVVDLIQVLEDGSIQIRKATIIKENGVEIARTFHSHCKYPGENVDEEDERVRVVADSIWTESVIDKYESKTEVIKK
jgi:hypothetical protein